MNSEWYEHFSRVFQLFVSFPDKEDRDDVIEDKVATCVSDEPISTDEVYVILSAGPVKL